MISRVVEVSTHSRLSVRNRQLIVEQEDEVVGTVPLEDLGVLVLDEPTTLITQRLLTLCGENNVAVIVCNEKHLPTSLLLPFEGNTLHTKVLREQIAVSEPKKKRLWQQIVQAKIRAQMNLLVRRGEADKRLTTLAAFVRSGDPDNVEGRAAAIYFDCLFGGHFSRNHEEPGVNAMLNYGYAVLRAAVARAVVGAGFHPALGIHHRSQYDPFCLADDLMEPLRPLVDAKVLQVVEEFPDTEELIPEIKRGLLTVMEADVRFGKRKMPITAALPLYLAGVRRAFSGELRKLEIPSP